MDKRIQVLLNSEISKLPTDISDQNNSKEYVTNLEVLKSHFIIADYFNELGEDVKMFGVKNQNNLVSAISRQTVGYGDLQKWNNIYEYAATVFFGLIKNHPFHDANKRTALLTLIYHLFKNKLVFKVTQTELDKFAVNVAELGSSNNLQKYNGYSKFEGQDDEEIKFIAYFLRKKTHKLDHTPRTITFNELNVALKNYGFWLENTDGGNSINVMKLKFGLLGKKAVAVTQVGCPGWKKPVSQNALKTIRQATGLTPENGFDWKVITKEVEPLSSLISQYEQPLKRLRDK